MRAIVLANYTQENYGQYQPSANVELPNKALHRGFFGEVIDKAKVFLRWVLNGIKNFIKSIAGFNWCKLRKSVADISAALRKVTRKPVQNDEDDDQDCNGPGSSITSVDKGKEQKRCRDCVSDCKPGAKRPDYCSDPNKFNIMNDDYVEPTKPHFSTEEVEDFT
ncbi:uncharacterized protein LOC123292784 [Chrysoperla carnea]|uniref:uncharacterized protein LOC123292784 n=1 Tax=Chrysoperla carnea TaxID=189513 RepID=UPI001D08EA23|nr:uncharacterized protein LOC123292784 [Chrysoperla carnea]